MSMYKQNNKDSDFLSWNCREAKQSFEFALKRKKYVFLKKQNKNTFHLSFNPY